MKDAQEKLSMGEKIKWVLLIMERVLNVDFWKVNISDKY
jgi:hypothetical protein